MTFKEYSMRSEQDYYQILGISPSSNTKDMEDAYRKLAFRYHPDRNNMNPSANEKMRYVNEIFTTLSDPTKRRDYDIPRGYRTLFSRFKTGDKVKVNINSNTPYRDHTGVVDKEPYKDSFRFWYMVRFDTKGSSTISRFAEEELSEVDE